LMMCIFPIVSFFGWRFPFVGLPALWPLGTRFFFAGGARGLFFVMVFPFRWCSRVFASFPFDFFMSLVFFFFPSLGGRSVGGVCRSAHFFIPGAASVFAFFFSPFLTRSSPQFFPIFQLSFLTTRFSPQVPFWFTRPYPVPGRLPTVCSFFFFREQGSLSLAFTFWADLSTRFFRPAWACGPGLLFFFFQHYIHYPGCLPYCRRCFPKALSPWTPSPNFSLVFFLIPFNKPGRLLFGARTPDPIVLFDLISQAPLFFFCRPPVGYPLWS